MSFQLVPNSVTLGEGDHERRNSPNIHVISPNSIAFGADYVQVGPLSRAIHDAACLSLGQNNCEACI